MLKIAVVAALSLAFCAMVPGQAALAQQANIQSNLAYGPDPAQKLDLCLPTSVDAGARPAVIMIHGGYWTMGDKSAWDGLCQGAANQGIVAVTINYRLADGSGQHRWPAMLVDAQLAVRWLRSHAAQYGVDPRRICALGDSAGAHLAIFLAALDHTIPGDYAHELPAVSSSVACVVDNFGPSDISADSMWPPEQQLFGVTNGRAPEQEHAASPIFIVGPKTAPIMIVHGRDDKNVVLDQSTQLRDQLNRVHVPVRMTVFNGGHEFLGLSPQETLTLLQSELAFIKAAQPRS
jgi:acetyl esterase/lipase